MKRILLFMATNIAILLVISIVGSLLGLDNYLTQQGMNYSALLAWSALFGFGGSFISLLMSKWMAKRMMGAQVIEQPRNDAEQFLFNTVGNQAKVAGISMPEVAIFDSPQPNAFATGARRDAALVAVSTGLLRSMDRDEVEAVLGHEISHIANGDMVTLTLIQGVLNTFVFFLARVVGFAIDRALSGDRDRGVGFGYFIGVMLAQVLFGMVASVIVMWFSRQREFRADAGGAQLAGRGKMIAALEKLKNPRTEDEMPEQLAAFGISGGRTSRLGEMLMSHPPIEKRIEALKRGGSNA